MNAYIAVKIVHVLSACVILGTGAGIAFFMLSAHLSRDRTTFVAVIKMVVLADWMFTAPAVVIQLLSGLWLTHALGIPYGSLWFVLVVGLFMFVGLCWLPVVWIQHRLARLATDAYGSIEYQRLMKLWIALGIPAFSAVLVIFYLMVTKIGVDSAAFA